MCSHNFFTNMKDINGLQSNQNRNELQNNPSKKIRLDKKLSSNDKFPSQNVNVINMQKCDIESLDKKDWTNLEKNSLDNLGITRQTKLHLNTCFVG